MSAIADGCRSAPHSWSHPVGLAHADSRTGGWDPVVSRNRPSPRSKPGERGTARLSLHADVPLGWAARVNQADWTSFTVERVAFWRGTWSPCRPAPVEAVAGSGAST
jgi:hypothetical protein